MLWALWAAAMVALTANPQVGAGGEGPAPEDLATFLHSDLGSGSEAAIPRQLIWGLVSVAPERFGRTEGEFFERYGMIRDPASQEHLPYGMVPVRDPAGVPYLVFNCAWCHVGRVAGQTVLGLGNRALRQADMTHDLVQMGADPRFSAKAMIEGARKEAHRRGQLWRLADSAELTAAVELIKLETGRRWISDNSPIGPGLSIPSFIAQEKRFGLTPPAGLNPVVKYPSIWSYGVRSSFSSGGNFVGDISRTAIAPEFTKGRDAARLIAHPEPFRAVYRWMLATPPPKYPFPIDAALAEQGEDVYAVECLSCHGTNHQGTYREMLVKWDEVKTDPDRMRAFGPRFQAEVRALKIPDADFVYTDGYVAPQHDGLWARPPYLHNASVPSLRWLLEPAEDRPAIFYVGGEVAYDSVDVGDRCQQTVEEGLFACAPDHPGQRRYDTRERGRGKGGHEFGTKLSREEKRALLEYLKTL